jgi:aldehyde dehydrogenase (NAD+)
VKNIDKFYIDGRWVDAHSSQVFPVMNPATEEKIAEISLGDAVDVDRAVAAAGKAFKTFSRTTKAERLELLKSLLSVTEKRKNDLADAMSLEMGAPISMARDHQADGATGNVPPFIDALSQLEERETLSNGTTLLREPIGVCGLITPWNWPIYQAALKVIPALATGCTCILKPSEHTPLSAVVYAEIIEEAGYSAGVFNLIHGEGPVVGSALSCHPDIQMISFTGSTRAGTAVTRDAAPTVKRVTLELGGKSPNIVFADCDLAERVAGSVAECFFNTGQSCDSPTRMLVERSCYDEAMQIAKAAAESQEVGEPSREGAHIGPLFDKIQFDRVQNLIQVGIDEGATLLAGGLGRPDGFDRGWYVKPTIFADVSNSMRIAQEEIFGPVLVMIPFEDEDEAIRLANETPYGLASYLQSSDSERIERVAAQLRAGSVRVNGGEFSYGSPFGGYKQSGNGREGGVEGLHDYLEMKTLHFRPDASGAQ